MNKTHGTDRKNFCIACIYGIWTLIAGVMAGPAAAYLLLPPKPRQEPEWFEAGDLGRLPANVPEEIVFRRNRVDGWKVTSEKTSAWVVKLAEDNAVAFAPQCTHLGCGYHWDEQKQNFLCPCHTSTFGLDGRVLSGPAPRPLDRYRVKVDGKKLLLGAIVRSGEAG